MSPSKKQRFSIPTAAQSQAGEIIAAAESEETVQLVPIHLLELDPRNRPLCKLNLVNPEAIDPRDPHAGIKKEFLARLKELADSIIAANGVKQPIRVFKQIGRASCRERVYGRV